MVQSCSDYWMLKRTYGSSFKSLCTICACYLPFNWNVWIMKPMCFLAYDWNMLVTSVIIKFSVPTV